MISNCFETLAAVPGIIVNIISDSITPRHRKIIEGYPQFTYIERSENGGVAKTKNTSIRVLLEQDVDIGFLADDDLIFKRPDVFIAYAVAILKTGIPHFCFHQINHPNEYENITINNFEVRKIRFVMGALMTFTPALVEKVGGFRIFDYKYGHEHSNFTMRCRQQREIPFFCDIVNSSDYVVMDHRSLMGDHGKSIATIDQKKFKQNEIDAHTRLTEWFPLTE